METQLGAWKESGKRWTEEILFSGLSTFIALRPEHNFPILRDGTEFEIFITYTTTKGWKVRMGYRFVVPPLKVRKSQ